MLARLIELGIELPLSSPPVASYVPVAVGGKFAFVSGQIARRNGEVLSPGRLGDNVSVEEGYNAAREAALDVLAAMDEAGLLDRIQRVVKVTGYVACTPDFADQPKVVNGASDLLVKVFGDAGKHARAAVGVSALPLGACVEIEAVFSFG